jgi:hypothetical protein
VETSEGRRAFKSKFSVSVRHLRKICKVRKGRNPELVQDDEDAKLIGKREVERAYVPPCSFVVGERPQNTSTLNETMRRQAGGTTTREINQNLRLHIDSV